MAWWLLTTSLLTTVAALLGAVMAFGRRRSAPERAEDLPLQDAPGLIAELLPRRLRSAWKLGCAAVAIVMLGLPHHLAVIAAFQGHEATVGRYGATGFAMIYAGALAWWLGLMVLSGRLIARLRL